MKSIDIITPFYNGNEYLNAMSLMIQANIHNAHSSFKVNWIIVNDSPSCKVQEDKIAPEVPHRIINHSRNSGIHQARVTGIQNSTADYILLLDQDDAIAENYLSRQLRKIGNADVVVCNGYAEDAHGGRNKIYKDRASLAQIRSLNVYLNITNVIKSPGQCLIKRTSVPDAYLQYIMKDNGSDDLLLWILMLTEKKEFAINKACLYTHKYTGVNVSAENSVIGKSSFEVENILKKFNVLTPKQIKDLDKSIKWSLMDGTARKKALFQNLHLVSIRGYWKVRKRLSKKL